MASMRRSAVHAGMRSSDATHSDGELFVHSHGQKGRLRLIACGSVDDGKSTLIGRLLYECKSIFEDQLATLAADSQVLGTRGGELDFALLTDGLAAEREQGITIDVAYRYFSTDTRNFILADAPGHEQYTRNMVTGASTADVAVVLVDARKGVVTQTRRRTYVVSLLGIRRIVLAVNKMDLVAYSNDAFSRIERDYAEFGSRIGLADITCIPVSAVHGDSVASRSTAMRWYTGPTLLEHLNDVTIADYDPSAKPFRMPVQRVIRSNQEPRSLAGMVASGSVGLGDTVALLPSGRYSRVARIFIGDRGVDTAVAGQSIALTLADDVDVGRGDVVADPKLPLGVADQYQADRPSVIHLAISRRASDGARPDASRRISRGVR
jgi:bifunctional enzyme CysN/CysC